MSAQKVSLKELGTEIVGDLMRPFLIDTTEGKQNYIYDFLQKKINIINKSKEPLNIDFHVQRVLVNKKTGDKTHQDLTAIRIALPRKNLKLKLSATNPVVKKDTIKSNNVLKMFHSTIRPVAYNIEISPEMGVYRQIIHSMETGIANANKLVILKFWQQIIKDQTDNTNQKVNQFISNALKEKKYTLPPSSGDLFTRILNQPDIEIFINVQHKELDKLYEEIFDGLKEVINVDK